MTAVEEIAIELRHRLDSERLGVEADDPESVTLGRGAPGVALMFAYHARTTESDEDLRAATRLLEHATDAVGRMALSPSLFSGFTGVAWTFEHVRGVEETHDDDGTLVPVDEALCAYIQRSPSPSGFDLIDGLVGIGVYALERLPSELARRCAQGVVHRLEDLAEVTSEGTTWFLPPHLMASQARAMFPRGHYNLGVAHGVPGIIGFLARAVAAGILEERAERMLRGAVAWALAHRLPAGAAARWPSFVDPDSEPRPGRAAWCYGDPGVATVLLAAAEVLEETEWRDAAVEAGVAATRRPLSEAEVADASLCHGAAGLAHIFNRLHQGTGIPAFRSAALRCLDAVLEHRREGNGIAGFLTWRESRGAWVEDPGLLTGAAGTALALLAAATDTPPAWDRILLISGAGEEAR
jgi:lantibiotic modifying enzyme